MCKNIRHLKHLPVVVTASIPSLVQVVLIRSSSVYEKWLRYIVLTACKCLRFTFLVLISSYILCVCVFQHVNCNNTILIQTVNLMYNVMLSINACFIVITYYWTPLEYGKFPCSIIMLFVIDVLTYTSTHGVLIRNFLEILKRINSNEILKTWLIDLDN